MKKKVISLLLLLIITTIVCQIVGLGTANAAQRYMSDDEAIYFLSFVYNCNYKYEDIKNDSFFKMLTGQIDDEQSNSNIKITFLTTLQTQLNQHIDKASYNCDILRSDLQQYLEEQAKGMKNLPEQEYDAFYNKELGYLKDALIDWGAGIIAQKAGIYITEDIIENINLATSVYSDIIGAPEKAKKYADYVINAVKAGFLPINEELTGRYTYFSCYLSNRKAYGYDPNFDLIYDYNKLAIMQNYPLGTIDWYPGSKDSWTEHIDDIERWGDIVIQIENSLTSSGSSSGETGDQYCTITFNSNCDEIPNETRTYDITAESYDFPAMERAGYVFGGWYADKECTQKPNITGSTATVYAKWIKTQFKITLNSNCNETDSYSYIYDSTKNNWLDPYSYKMERPGYAFMGWYTDAACSNPLNGSITVNKDLTFYAKWKRQYSYEIEDGKATITKLLFTVTINGTEQTDLTLPSKIDGYPVAKIGDRAFYLNSSLTSVTIPGSITRIGNDAFCACDKLTSVTIGNCVTSIGYSAFSACRKLTSVTIGNGVTDIEDEAFYGCSGLTNLILGNGVTSIGEKAFYHCSSLTSVTIPGNVKYMGWCAFSDCSSLTSVTLVDGVTTIGDSAFSRCSSLINVTIPASVTSISRFAFDYCSSLTNVNVAEENENYCSVDGILFNRNKTKLIRCLIGKNEYVIPSSVTTIGDSAFSSCCSLTSITIPDSVIDIGNYAFDFCSSLKNITIPDSVTNIGDWAFRNCYDLTSVTIGNGVINIGREAFSGSGLTSVTIGNGVTTIGNWAFYDCSGLTSITIPDSVTTIGWEAFSGSGLASVTIPDSITTIGERAFSHCDSLTSVTIPDSVTTIGREAFSGSGLVSVTIPYSVTTIGERAFSYCFSLTSVTIPDSVTTIGERAFYCCSSLTSVTIPNSVTTIAEGIFYGCSGLTSVTISDSVTTIGEMAFYNCNKLKDVYYTDTEPKWNKIQISENGNEYLVNATHHYAGDLKVTLNINNNMKSFEVEPQNISKGCTVILAIYKDNVLVDMKNAIYDGNNITFTTTINYDSVKIMAWDSMVNMKPLCDSAEL